MESFCNDVKPALTLLQEKLDILKTQPNQIQYYYDVQSVVKELSYLCDIENAKKAKRERDKTIANIMALFNEKENDNVITLEINDYLDLILDIVTKDLNKKSTISFINTFRVRRCIKNAMKIIKEANTDGIHKPIIDYKDYAECLKALNNIISLFNHKLHFLLKHLTMPYVYQLCNGIRGEDGARFTRDSALGISIKCENCNLKSMVYGGMDEDILIDPICKKCKKLHKEIPLYKENDRVRERSSR